MDFVSFEHLLHFTYPMESFISRFKNKKENNGKPQLQVEYLFVKEFETVFSVFPSFDVPKNISYYFHVS